MGEQMGEQILETLRNYWDQFVELFLSWSQSPACYTQLGVVFGATLLAFLVSPIVKSRFREPKEGGRYFVLRFDERNRLLVEGGICAKTP